MKVRVPFLTVFTLILLSTAITMNAPAQVVTDGLVSYWTLDRKDIEGNTVKDVWGNNDGTFVGAPQVVDGIIGQALQFNGVDDGVDCGGDVSLTAIAAEVTLEVWIKSDKIGPRLAAGIGKLGQNTYIIGVNPQGGVGFVLWNGAIEVWPFFSKNQIPLNEWHHIVGTYDRRTARIYIDGKLDNTKVFGGKLEHNDEHFWIGRRRPRPTRAFKGIIDEVRVYNRALNDAEIKQNFAVKDNLAVEPGQKLALTWGGVKVEK